MYCVHKVWGFERKWCEFLLLIFWYSDSLWIRVLKLDNSILLYPWGTMIWMSLSPNLKIFWSLNHPLTAPESCVNSNRLSLCIEPKTVQTPLYTKRARYKSLGGWIETHFVPKFCCQQWLQESLWTLFHCFGCFDDGLWRRRNDNKDFGPIWRHRHKKHGRTFLFHTLQMWTGLVHNCVQLGRSQGKYYLLASYSVDHHWKYLHQSTVFPQADRQQRSAWCRQADPILERGAITK